MYRCRTQRPIFWINRSEAGPRVYAACSAGTRECAPRKTVRRAGFVRPFVDAVDVKFPRRYALAIRKQLLHPGVALSRREMHIERLRKPIDLVGDVETHKARMAGDPLRQRSKQAFFGNNSRRIGDDISNASVFIAD